MSELNFLPVEPQTIRADAVKNRTLVLEAATRLFAERDIHKVLMEDIAKAAGVGKGTVYRHFPNGKTDICIALLDEKQRLVQDRSLERLRAVNDPRDNLEWFIREVFAFVQDNRALLCAGVDGASGLMHPAHWWWRQTIHGLLVQMNTPVDADYVADMMFVMLDVHTLYFLEHVRGHESARVLDNLLNTLYLHIT